MESCFKSNIAKFRRSWLEAENIHIEIRIAGFGGQGIIRTGLIIATASCVYDDKNVIQTSSYGPESRGGHCRSEVIVSDEDIDFPKVEHPDILVTMSQEAYSEYVDDLKENGILLKDPDLVQDQRKNLKIKTYDVPATRIAENLGKKVIANVVMIGALAAITNLFKVNDLRESIIRNVPERFVDLNLSAFHKGYEYGEKLRSSITEVS